MSEGPAFPSPHALRLVRRSTGATLRPLFGLASWSDAAASVAVVIDAPDVGDSAPDPRAIAAEIPSARDVSGDALVVVVDGGELASGFLSRLMRRKKPPVSRAARGSALLARGYVRLGGGVDPASGLDLAWGYAPPASADGD